MHWNHGRVCQTLNLAPIDENFEDFEESSEGANRLETKLHWEALSVA